MRISWWRRNVSGIRVLYRHILKHAIPNALKRFLNDRRKSSTMHAAEESERVGGFAREGEFAILERTICQDRRDIACIVEPAPVEHAFLEMLAVERKALLTVNPADLLHRPSPS